jgi:hypothetical protein
MREYAFWLAKANFHRPQHILYAIASDTALPREKNNGAKAPK